MTLVFGWRTAMLTTAAAVLLPLAAALARSLRNRIAARTLAAALIVMVGVFTPWLIGFAGFYDRWRWLTFAPFSNALLLPPLLYLHACALAHGRWPAPVVRHFVPGVAQFAYQSACFMLPMPLKRSWDAIAAQRIDIAGAILLSISFTLYSVRLMAVLRPYRVALAAKRSDDALFAAAWLSRSTIAFATLSILWSGTLLADAVAPLGYKGLMPLYATIAGFALYLGIAGWRHLALPFPTLSELAPATAAPAPLRDWRALGQQWSQRTRDARWYREDGITLRRLAALLGTNESYVSRALNEGIGVSFSDFINGLRCDEVAAGLRAGDDRPVLVLALEAGFASKASFNRCFRQRFAITPSAMRAAAQITKRCALPED